MLEKNKMLTGQIYDPIDPELVQLRRRAHHLSLEFNKLYEENPQRQKILDGLIPHNNGVYLQGPIQFDYGCFTTFGRNCYANFNLTVLDCAPVEIGDDVFMGCNVSLMTPVHPMIYEERKLFQRIDGVWTDSESAKPIKICNGVWIASNVVVCGGVTIGEGAVIGAGSVVTRDIPPRVFAAGNPCRVIRKITQNDSIYKRLN